MKRKTAKGSKGKDNRRSGAPLIQAFSTRFRAWRKQKGLLLREVAAELDVSTAIVAEWENGNRFPSVDHLQELARYTKIPAWKFLRP
jgi:transcriptional regulator with XRE-family HTH domain